MIDELTRSALWILWGICCASFCTMLLVAAIPVVVAIMSWAGAIRIMEFIEDEL